VFNKNLCKAFIFCFDLFFRENAPQKNKFEFGPGSEFIEKVEPSKVLPNAVE
jgi:hypothetical protein